jgi:hypothetical protein
MRVGMAVAVVIVFMLIQIHRYEVQSTVAHLRLGDEQVGERADLLRGAAQEQRLHAVVVIEVHVHGRQYELVMLVLEVGEALREIAGVMIVDVGERRYAVRRLLLLQAETLELGTHQVAHSLRPVLVALAMDEIVELLRESSAQ